MFRFADGIVMQTTQAKEYLPHSLQHKAVIMPNSIQEKVINTEVSTVRKKEIVSVGRIDSNKNQNRYNSNYSKNVLVHGDASSDVNEEKKLRNLNTIILMNQKGGKRIYSSKFSNFLVISLPTGRPSGVNPCALITSPLLTIMLAGAIGEAAVGIDPSVV